MFRPLAQGARCVVRQAVASRSSLCRASTPSPFLRSSQLVPAATISPMRWYATAGAMSKTEIEGRIMDLLKGFDKIQDTSKVSQTSHFSNDLGLDSLDTVEVVMAIEEEFSIEIPDKEADKIHSIDHAVEYILNQPDAH